MKIAILLIFLLCLQGTYSFGQDYQQLRLQLEEIQEKDQMYRLTIPTVTKKYGPNSKEMKELWKKIAIQDSANRLVVTRILDTYGWLGRDKIGSKANVTLFLVIQHADLPTQEKYLPLLRKAVKEGNAQASDLALVEDRVAVRQGKKQLFGSQINQDTVTGKFYVAPLEDPDNVDKRRAMMGLQPLSEYVKEWGIIWKPATEKPPVMKDNGISEEKSQLCDKTVNFTKIDLPTSDFEFSPFYLNNGQLVGFMLTINPVNFDTYKITCIDGKAIGERDYRYDKTNGVFIVKVVGATSEQALYPSTMIIDGKGYSFYSLTKWYNYKKLSIHEVSPTHL